MDKLRILVYGDINLNIIDGSAVWLTSILNVLTINDNNDIDLLLKTPIRNNQMISSIEKYENINKLIVNEIGEKLDPAEAVRNIERYNEEKSYDCIILRGFELSVLATQNHSINKKCICYITDFEHDANKILEEERKRLVDVYNNCAYFCAQTPEARESLKNILNVQSDDKFIILNPMIPDYSDEKQFFYNRKNKLIYSGKFAKDWYTKEIVDSFKDLRKSNSEIKLTVVGNLFRADLNEYKDEIISELENNKNIDWHKGVDRVKSNSLISEADIGIAWRSSQIDNNNSVELSTKVLEYCRAGKPIILNKINMYEKLLGKEYPLFIENDDEFTSKVKLALEDEVIYRKSAKMVYEAGKKYTFTESYKRLHNKLWQMKNNKKRIVFAGHDLKFLNMFIDFVKEKEGYEVRIDQWKGHDKHDEDHTKECLEWADIIFCEWGLGNAKWYSNNKKSWQKLIVRMHLQERDTPYHRSFNYNNIDQIIAISPYIYEEFSCKMNVPREKMTMIYNFIDCEKFNLEKTEESKYNLGIVGICPRRKRLDLAIDLLEKLVDIDNRYKLYIKGKRPEEYAWVWNKADERAYYEEILNRINTPKLKNNVVFDGHGSDMELWFKKIGYILSTSDFESFHLAPAEGMCSGTVPLVRNWEGSNTIYNSKYISSNIESDIKYIINNRDNVSSEEYKQYVNSRFNKDIIFKKIFDLIDN